ncbi:hypothetical protein QUF74_01695 [Candidatus Halobeggiatoa sp. HSG11]|nr:hypothetical protein [Candidatus Halobeggiatoa sp. HSG11]
MRYVIIVFLIIPLSVIAHDKYSVVEVVNGASIIGKVTFTGKDPAPKTYLVTKDMEICGMERKIDFVKVNKDGGLTDVVVYLDGIKTGKKFIEHKKQIKQEKCDYGPMLSVVNQGENVEIINTDKTAHKMHTYEMTEHGNKTMFNISQPLGQDNTVTKKFDVQDGVSIKMQCDQHEFMQGYVYIAKTPYYALVKEDGSFSIDDIPAGEYFLKAWHSRLKQHPQMKIVIKNGQKLKVNLEYNK